MSDTCLNSDCAQVSIFVANTWESCFRRSNLGRDFRPRSHDIVHSQALGEKPVAGLFGCGRVDTGLVHSCSRYFEMIPYRKLVDACTGLMAMSKLAGRPLVFQLELRLFSL